MMMQSTVFLPNAVEIHAQPHAQPHGISHSQPACAGSFVHNPYGWHWFKLQGRGMHWPSIWHPHAGAWAHIPPCAKKTSPGPMMMTMMVIQGSARGQCASSCYYAQGGCAPTQYHYTKYMPRGTCTTTWCFALAAFLRVQLRAESLWYGCLAGEGTGQACGQDRRF